MHLRSMCGSGRVVQAPCADLEHIQTEPNILKQRGGWRGLSFSGEYLF